MWVAFLNSCRGSERSGRGESSNRNQLDHQFQSPLHPDVALFADTAERAVVGDADAVVLTAHVKRQTVSARDPSWKAGELKKHVRFHLYHCQAQFSTACEGQPVHLINHLADDVDRCHVLNDERENR